jgi:hypothetical protein
MNKTSPPEVLDRDTLARRRVLANMKKMSPEKILAIAVRAGIYTKDGKLTRAYRSE